MATDIESGPRTEDPVATADAPPQGTPAISNKPADEEEEESEDDDIYDELEAAHAKATGPSILRTTLAILGILMGTLAPPGLLLLFDGTFRRYNLILEKGPLGLNSRMEYIRLCLFLACAMSSYVFLEWLVGSFPTLLLRMAKGNSRSYIRRLQRMAGYLAVARFWVALSLWICWTAFLGGLFVYQSTFGQRLGAGLLGRAPDKSEVLLARATALSKDNWSFYVERWLMVAVLLMVLLAVAQYVCELLTGHFHGRAFAERVSAVNQRLGLLTKLQHALHRGRYSLDTVRVDEPQDDCRLLPDREGLLENERAARHLANDLYLRLVPANRDYLTADDLLSFCAATDQMAAWNLLVTGPEEAPIERKDLSKADLESNVVALCQTRALLKSSLKNNSVILQKMHGILVFIAWLLALLFSIPIFELGSAAVFVVFGLLWTSMGFLFQNTARVCFESMVFVFVEHAFDVGDRVLIDSEQLLVERIEIFTTIFRKPDGVAVYIPNANLAGKNICNLRRSGPQAEYFELVVNGNVSVEALWTLKNRLLEYCKSEPADFAGTVELLKYEAISDTQIKIQFAVLYTSNFQDAALRTSRHNKFEAVLKQTAEALSLT